MDNPSDEAIAEALRAGGYRNVDVGYVRHNAPVSQPCQAILAHARIIDQRNKLVKALERIRNPAVIYDGMACKQIADAALTQFRSGQ